MKTLALLFAVLMVTVLSPTLSTPTLRRLQDDNQTLMYTYPPAVIISGGKCMLEKDFDFLDNDIANKPSKYAENCCDICATYPGCTAFTWSDYNGGTCWLKSGRGTVVVKPGVFSALVFTRFRNSFTMDKGIDYVDHDIGSESGVGYDAFVCYNKCRNFQGCRAFSHSPDNGGTCWYKTDEVYTNVKSNVKSSKVYPDPDYPACGLEYNIDYVDNDIGSAPSPTAQGCCTVCQNWYGCRAFAWTSQNGGTCWLKNLKGEAVYKPNVVSAQVWANPSPPICSLEMDTDYQDNDIGNKPSSDPYLCCSICMNTSGCNAFSWSNANGGTCWLKSRKGPSVYKQGVKSAVIAFVP